MSKLFRSPIFVFLVALVIFISLARFGFAGNLFVLLDLSQSVNSKDYNSKTSDFHKNLQAISRYILELESNHFVKVIGITESSFQRPHVLLSGSTPSRSGFFQEKLKKRKLDLYRRWKRVQQNIAPQAKYTDIIGALNLVAAFGTRGDR